MFIYDKNLWIYGCCSCCCILLLHKKKKTHHDIIDLSIWILNTKVSIKLLISNENMINEINFFSSCLLEIVIQKNINKTFPTILFLYMYNE